MPQLITDLHIHSKYSRACSASLTIPNLSMWSAKKGIQLMGTGDCLHPRWLEEIKKNLVEVASGVYEYKNRQNDNEAKFVLSTEVALIYKQGERVRRLHLIILCPNLKALKLLRQNLLAKKINLSSDGRPIMGIHAEEFVDVCKSVDENIEIIPAHAWTPHFGIFGSLSGFNSIEECFGKMSKHIFAIETGLSSDPKMNWQITELDNITLISCSDAHSLAKLGREATVINLQSENFSYYDLIVALKDKTKISYTIEFFPEEGKYHLDGHRDCKFSCEPDKTKKLAQICPVCKKKLLKGVLDRVEELAQRNLGYRPSGSPDYFSIIPLEEVVAETLGVGAQSKKVQAWYESMVAHIPEFEILLNSSKEQLEKISTPQIAESIIRVRQGKVNIVPGYDGVFGKIQIYSDKEKAKLNSKLNQTKFL